jgi:hypothetical protein
VPPPVERNLDQLVADCAEVARELQTLRIRVPATRGAVVVPEDVRIPEVAVSLVSGLDDYGD